MKVRRSRLTGDFVQIPNATARDSALSHTARGILVELLSRPDGYETSCDQMWRESVARHGEDSPGRRVFRAAFAELKAVGYMTSERARLENGRHGTVLTVYDLPGGTGVPQTGRPAPAADNAPGGSDVPDAGTPGPGPDGGTGETPGDTDVPHAGTPDAEPDGEAAGDTDVPHAGTPETADVPHAGTSGRPGEMDVSAGGTDVPLSDVPHAGTSNRKRSKKTELNTGGDGRQATTGSGGGRAGGCAAPGDDEALNSIPAAAVGEVIRGFPRRLAELLPQDRPVPAAIEGAIRRELVRGLTPRQIVHRIRRRYLERGIEWDAESADGDGIRSAFGALLRLIDHGNCTSDRCDDGMDFDTGDECRTCARDREDRQPARQEPQEPVQGAFLTAVPSGPGATPAARQEPAQAPLPRQRPGRGHPECRSCRDPLPKNTRTDQCRDCREREALEAAAREAAMREASNA